MAAASPGNTGHPVPLQHRQRVQAGRQALCKRGAGNTEKVEITMSRSGLREQAKARALELLGECDGMTIRQLAACLTSEGLYSGQAFHADRAATSYARSIFVDLLKINKVRLIERSVSRGGYLYRLKV
jgi:hypothetical protein